jgi:hypothetical protein
VTVAVPVPELAEESVADVPTEPVVPELADGAHLFAVVSDVSKLLQPELLPSFTTPVHSV